MKILLLDVDLAHNKKVESTLSQDPKTHVHTFARLEPMLEVLNGNPALELKQKEIEKSVSDAEAMSKKMAVALTEIKAKIDGKKMELDSLKSNNAPADQINKVIEEISGFEGQYAKGDEVHKKTEFIVTTRKAELDNLKASSEKPEDKKADIILVDRAFLGNTPQQWMADFRNAVTSEGNKNVPLVVMGYNDDIDYIKKTLVPGISDYFVKPVDILMLKHNTTKISGGKLDSDQKVYELQTKSELKILRIGTVTKMSEFELDVQTDNAFQENEIVEFHADHFSGGEKGGRLLGRCLKCEADSTEKGKYVSNFSFVGQSPHSMNEMRKWLKLQYVNSKKAQ